MKRKLLVALLIVTAGALLLPTLASPLSDEVDSELHEDEKIEMAPSDGPNGVYATYDENDKIAIKITEERQEAAKWEGGSGVSENTVTEIDDIFDITYTGEDEARVWLDEMEEAGITFYIGDDPENTFEGELNNVSLDEGEVVSVGLLIDTSVDDHEVEEVSGFGVNAEIAEPEASESTVTLTDGEIHPSFESVTVNESGVNVTAAVENTGQTIADDTVALSVDGEEVATESTSELTGGDNETIQFDEALSLPAGEEVELQLETSDGDAVNTTEVAADDPDEEPEDDATEGEPNEGDEEETGDETDDEQTGDYEGDEESEDGEGTDGEEASATEGEAETETEDEEVGDAPLSPLQDNPLTQTLGEFTTATVLLLLAGMGVGGLAAAALRRKLTGG